MQYEFFLGRRLVALIKRRCADELSVVHYERKWGEFFPGAREDARYENQKTYSGASACSGRAALHQLSGERREPDRTAGHGFGATYTFTSREDEHAHTGEHIGPNKYGSSFRTTRSDKYSDPYRHASTDE